MAIDVEQFLDTRNIWLWEILSNNYHIKIEPSSDSSYGLFTANQDVVIYVTPNEICKTSFTHELLHLYLNYKEFFLGNSIIRLFSNDQKLSKLFTNGLLQHIGNCIDHLKMFKLFCDLGFDKKSFLLDFNQYKCDNYELHYIKSNYNLGLADFFVGKLITVLCDPNNEHDYSLVLKELEIVDSILFNSVRVLVKETSDYDIEKENSLNFYHPISYNFYNSVKNWLAAKEASV